MGRSTVATTSLSAENFVEFFDQADVGLAILDDQLRYLAVNRYLAILHGASAKSHIGKRLQDVVGGLTPQLEPAYKRVVATGRPVPKLDVKGAVSPRTMRGHWRDNLFPLKNSKGKVKQVCAVVADLLPGNNAPDRTASCADGVLRSWKEISQYARACIKTVQRWEQLHGFPIRRLKASKGAVVFAMKAEVDQWLQDHPATKNTMRRDAVFRSLFMTSPLPTLIIGPERVIIDANFSMATLLDENRDDLLGTQLENIWTEMSSLGEKSSSGVQEISRRNGTVFLAEYALECLEDGLRTVSFNAIRAQPVISE